MRNLYALAISAAVLAAAIAPSWAEQVEFPSRKSGYWEIRMVQDAASGMPEMAVHACIDAASDKAMMAAGLSMTKDMCPKMDMKRDGGTIVIESECKVAGMTSTTKTVMTGDFQTSYKVDITGTVNGMPAIAGGTKTPEKMAMTQNAKWLSDKCPDGVKAGDMKMPGGITVNVNKMLEKNNPTKAAPQPGHQK